MLVLLPGLDGTGDLFGPFLRTLDGVPPVHIIRYPRDVILAYAELHQYVRNQLPTSEPITIIAESFSGPIALGLTEERDLNIRAVVLVGSFAFRPLGIAGFLLAHVPLGLLFRTAPPELAVRMLLLGSAASGELVAAAIEAISSVLPTVLAGRVRAALTLRPYKLNGPSTRVVAIFSTRDRLIGGAARRSLEEACPVLEQHWIPAPHCALQVSPEKIVAILRETGILGPKC